MTDYKIISAEYTDELEKQIKRLLYDGYKLAGGVSVNNNYFIQAVYKD